MNVGNTQNIQGVIKRKHLEASEILTIDGLPLSQLLIQHNGKEMLFSIQLDGCSPIEHKGIADLYYFEGKYGRRTKYVNDFFISDVDIIEFLLEHENEYVKLEVTTFVKEF